MNNTKIRPILDGNGNVTYPLTCTEAVVDETGSLSSKLEAIQDQLDNYQPIEITGNVTNAADEEDLTSINDLLKFKNRNSLNGLGYYILRRGSTIGSQMTLSNTIYEVRYNFDISQENPIEIPSSCILYFNGGSFIGGTLVGNQTYVNRLGDYSIFNGTSREGTWKAIQDINQLAAQVAENTSDISTLTTQVSTNTNNISTNTDDIRTLSGYVSTNTDDISTLSTNYTNLNTAVGTNTSDISNLSSSLTTLSGDALTKTVQTFTTAEKDQVATNLSNKDATNGMARIELKATDNFKTVVEGQTSGNTIFVIKYDFTLTDNVTVPANCVLKFEGGSISGNGANKDTLTGNNTVIVGIKCFNSSITLSGSFKNIEFPLDIYNVSNGDDISAFLNVLVQLGKNIIIPQGNYYCDEVDIPISFAGCSIKGTGFSHYNDGGTQLKSSKSSYMFKFANGANNISITDIRFEGDNKGTKCIDGTYGAFNVFQRCGFYNFTSHGIYSRQGLLRIDNIFCGNNDIGLELWSDSTVDNSEFTGGRIPLKISAGGDRLTNIWANSATECCLLLERQQGENHENTSLTNLYVGEVNNMDGNEHPIIQFKGFASNPVRGIQMTNSYIVAAVSQGKTCMLDMQYCKEIVLSNLVFRGIGAYTTVQSRTNSAISIANVEYCNISNCDIRDISGNGINLIGNDNTEITICNNSFRDCGMSPIDSTDAAVIKGRAASLNISDNIFNSYYNVTYAFEPTDPYFSFENNLIRYPNQKIIGGAYNTSYSFKKYGNPNTICVRPHIVDSTINDSNINNSKRNFKNTFQVYSTGSGASVDILNIADYRAENLAYLISAMQTGTSLNCVFGILITSSIYASAITTAYNNTGNADNDGIYKKKFVIDSGKLVMELGTAYGPTTWQICITPL